MHSIKKKTKCSCSNFIEKNEYFYGVCYFNQIRTGDGLTKERVITFKRKETRLDPDESIFIPHFISTVRDTEEIGNERTAIPRTLHYTVQKNPQEFRKRLEIGSRRYMGKTRVSPIDLDHQFFGFGIRTLVDVPKLCSGCVIEEKHHLVKQRNNGQHVLDHPSSLQICQPMFFKNNGCLLFYSDKYMKYKMQYHSANRLRDCIQWMIPNHDKEISSVINGIRRFQVYWNGNKKRHVKLIVVSGDLYLMNSFEAVLCLLYREELVETEFPGKKKKFPPKKKKKKKKKKSNHHEVVRKKEKKKYFCCVAVKKKELEMDVMFGDQIIQNPYWKYKKLENNVQYHQNYVNYSRVFLEDLLGIERFRDNYSKV